jgi:large subunit ribosomal protein L15
MKLKKRKKNTRYRGSQTHFRGHRKRTKGSGNKGGVGMSGSENQKKSLIMNLYGPEYFGRDKALRRGKVRPQLKAINLSELIRRFDSLVKQGIAKQTPKGFEFNLIGYKLLASGGLNAKISVKASAASKSAIEQIKDAGGTLELEKPSEELNEDKKEKAEVKEEKKAKPAKKK